MKYHLLLFHSALHLSLSSGERELKFDDLGELVEENRSLSSGERELKLCSPVALITVLLSLSSGERELK